MSVEGKREGKVSTSRLWTCSFKVDCKIVLTLASLIWSKASSTSAWSPRQRDYSWCSWFPLSSTR